MQKWEKVGNADRFYRCITGPELVQEEDGKKRSNGDILHPILHSGAITLVISSSAIEYPSLMPLAFLLHQGSHSDAKIYKKIL